MQCDYFDADVCRSCTLMGTPYTEQVAAKEARVRELLSPWPELRWLAPFTSAESGFRNKAKLVVGGSITDPTLGILGSNGQGIDLRECGLYEAELAATFPVLADFIARAQLTPFDVPTGRGELKNIIISISPSRELMIRFVLRSTEAVVRIRKHLGWLRDQLPHVAVATVNLLPERKAVPEGREEIILTEQEVLPMRLGSVTLYLRPQSFFQTNTPVARGLYQQARIWVDSLIDDDVQGYEHPRSISGTERPAAGSSHDVRGAGSQSHQIIPLSSRTSATDELGAPLRLWDLYCGVGGFALHCAGPHREVFGVEISEQAIESARLAAHELHSATPETGPIHFLAGDAHAAARQTQGSPDVVVVNPPRRGIGKLAEWINNSPARHLIYSSCNPVTLAKDLANMPGFAPREVRVFDMFPQTTHTETMVLASRRN